MVLLASYEVPTELDSDGLEPGAPGRIVPAYSCMKASHAGMGVSSSDFDALVGDLVATLNTFKVPGSAKRTNCAARLVDEERHLEKPMVSMH